MCVCVCARLVWFVFLLKVHTARDENGKEAITQVEVAEAEKSTHTRANIRK